VANEFSLWYISQQMFGFVKKGNLMFDIERLLGSMLGSSTLGRAAGSMGAGLGSVNGGIGAGLSKGALGVGALGVAWAAFEHYQEQNAATAAGTPPPPPPMQAMPPPPPMLAMSPPAPVEVANREADATHLIRAMIAAAYADGAMDSDERSRILERALTAGLSAATQQFLLAQIAAPAGLADIISQTRDGLKRETYGAALMAISDDTDAEKAYLSALAVGLGLSAEDVLQINQMTAIK
jgi:uncharacterized membrane protein YebE (DUF533 family)